MPNHESYPCPQNTEQLTLAENLCVRCSGQAAHTRSKNPLGKVYIAERLAEFAIATDKFPAKSQSIESANNILTKTLLRKNTLTVKNRAIIMKGLLPALLDRAYRRPAQQQNIRYANQAFGEVLVNRLYDNTDANEVSEALVLYLLSREGADDFFYAGTVREDRSHENLPRNHDIYKLWETPDGRLTKFPVQLKANKGSAKYDVPVLVVRAALKPVLASLHSKSLHEITNTAARERLNEASGREEAILDFATHCLQSAITSLIYEEIVSDD